MSPQRHLEPPFWLSPAWILPISELASHHVVSGRRAWVWSAKTPVAVVVVGPRATTVMAVDGTPPDLDELLASVAGLSETIDSLSNTLLGSTRR